MQIALKSTVSHNDAQYVRGLLAEGIARMLVERAAKNTASAADGPGPERDGPSTKKGGALK